MSFIVEVSIRIRDPYKGGIAAEWSRRELAPGPRGDGTFGDALGAAGARADALLDEARGEFADQVVEEVRLYHEHEARREAE